MSPIFTASRRFLRCTVLLLLLAGAVAPTQANVTVTDANGVVYDVVSDTEHTLTVSAINNTYFSQQTVAITIPKTLTDHSTAPSYTGEYTVVSMAEKAFAGTPITSVTIEAEITAISKNAFQGCTSLTEVSLPPTITTINANAFDGCSSLTKINLPYNDAGDTPSGVTTIGAYAFQDCAALEDVALPATLTTMGSYAFSGCASITEVSIPEGCTVLNTGTYKGCTSLKTITLPGNLKSIGSYAFQGCTALSAPGFPATLTSIGGYAFKGCTSLGALTFPDNVTVGKNAFNQAMVSSITWPETKITLSEACFKEVTGLVSVTFPSCVASIPTNAFQESSVEKVEFTNPECTIGQQAFYKCTSLSSLIFPQTFASIGKMAFANCEKLQSVTLPEGVNLGNGVFDSCDLNEIIIPNAPLGTWVSEALGEQDSITSITFPNKVSSIPEGACKDWSNLSEVNIEGAESIGTYAFSGCSALQSISLPNTLTSIGNRAFSSTGLQTLTCPENLVSIGNYAFSNCNTLESIQFSDKLESIDSYAFAYCDMLTSVTFPVSLSYISNYAFGGCKSLESVIFPEGCKLKEISAYCFSKNNATSTSLALKSVTLHEGLETIGADAFAYTSQLTSVSLPNSLKEICEYAFYKCSSFGELTLPAGVSVGDSAFASAGVTKINFPEAECSFGTYCFASNSKIEEAVFPEWMEKIPEGFCQNWSALTQLTLSDQITDVGDKAFQDCSKLRDFYLPPTVTTIGAYAFSGCSYSDKDGNMFCPELVFNSEVSIGDNAFQNATIGSISFNGCADFGSDVFKSVTTITKFAFPSCMEAIPDGFCSGWSKLTEVTIPPTVTKIGDSVFEGCTKLTSVVLPEAIDSIGSKAFYNSGITSFTFPDHALSYVGKAALAYSKLQSLEIPVWMTEVPIQLCNSCKSLISLTWAERKEENQQSVTIGESAFNGCSKLATITMPPVEATFGDSVFSSCSSATAIEWSDKPLTLGASTFSNCKALSGTLTIPSTVSAIPSYCFYQTTGLSELDLSRSKVNDIGDRAFYNSGIKAIKWAESLESLSLSTLAFASTGLTELEIPGYVSSIPGQCFQHCNKLESVTFNEGLETIGQDAFYMGGTAPAVTELKFPSSLKSIGVSAFSGWKNLKSIEFNEGLETIGAGVFPACAVETLEFPTTLTSIGSGAFKNCASLVSVVSKAENLTLSSAPQTVYSSTVGLFNGCTSLKSFTTYGHVSIRNYVFNMCDALEEFVCLADGYVDRVGMYAFCGCKSLKSFPYLKETTVDDYAFKDCTSLTEMVLPTTDRFYQKSYAPKGYLQGASSLQQVIWPNTGSNFTLQAIDLEQAPLTAISYSYVDDISNISTYTGNSDNTVASPETSILMVKRGERWKYMEAGYGELFNIIEMKEPRFDIIGDIYSQYDAVNDVNNYTAKLRWEVPLSDLNADGETTVHVYRDDVKIADVVFSKPSEPKKVEGLTSDEVIEVTYTVNGESRSFTGDFDFPVTDDDGNVTYVMQYCTTDPVMYFDATTHKRLLTIDTYGYTSWFTMTDTFSSPVLSEPGVPTTYKYTAVMDGYDYEEYENNTDLAVGDDGLRYHLASHSFESLASEAYAMPIPMAVPTFTFTGLYSSEDIAADTDHHLAVTPTHDSVDRKYKLNYTIDSDLITQKGKKGTDGTAEYIITGITLNSVDDDGSLTEVGTATLKSTTRKGEGSITITKGTVTPGNRYQTMVTSTYRGSFGSPILTLPDAPVVAYASAVSPITVDYTTHFMSDWGSHTPYVFKARNILTPDSESLKTLGYNEDTRLTASDISLGLWRSITPGDTQSAPAMASSSTGFDSTATLTYHLGNDLGDSDPSAGIDAGCLAEGGISLDDDGNLIYTDVYEYPMWQYSLSYNGRVYVKVPEYMLRNSDAWMVADASQTVAVELLTSAEGLSTDPSDPTSGLWYDFQGRRVLNPVSGEIYIRLTEQGARQTVYP